MMGDAGERTVGLDAIENIGAGADAGATASQAVAGGAGKGMGMTHRVDEHTRREWLLALVALAIGILWDRLVLRPLGTVDGVDGYARYVAAFWLCYMALLYAYYWKKLKADRLLWYVAGGCAAVCALCLFQPENVEYKATAILVLPAVLMAHAQLAAGPYHLKETGKMAVAWFLGWVWLPFDKIPVCFRTLWSALGSKGGRGRIGKALLGLLICVPVLALVIPLLCGADWAFGYFAQKAVAGFDIRPFVYHTMVSLVAFVLFFSFLWNVGVGGANALMSRGARPGVRGADQPWAGAAVRPAAGPAGSAAVAAWLAGTAAVAGGQTGTDVHPAAGLAGSAAAAVVAGQAEAADPGMSPGGQLLTLDPVTGTVSLGVIAALYMAFCIVQAVFLIMRAGLPEGMTYSQYAREGFAQTIAVCGINLSLFGFFVSLCLQEGRACVGAAGQEDGHAFVGAAVQEDGRACVGAAGRGPRASMAVKALLAVLLAQTFFMLCVGFYKLSLYIGAYGLTWLRFVSAWFIFWLVAVLVLCAIRLCRPRIPALALALLILLGWYVVLGAANPQGSIQRHNETRTEAVVGDRDVSRRFGTP